MWVAAVLVSLVILAIYLGLKLSDYGISSFPWYFYVITCISPFICLSWVEYLKRTEKALLDRAEKLRRLQFETRYVLCSYLFLLYCFSLLIFVLPSTGSACGVPSRLASIVAMRPSIILPDNVNGYASPACTSHHLVRMQVPTTVYACNPSCKF